MTRLPSVANGILSAQAGFPNVTDHMMNHGLSAGDRRFREEFEVGRLTPAEFNHRAHVRLAYVYLAEHDTGTAIDLMRGALQGFLRKHGIPETKYHETLTQAWILAVRHFMEHSPGSDSSDSFIYCNPPLLDSSIMMTHYSAEVLFGPEARARFVEPDRQGIPR